MTATPHLVVDLDVVERNIAAMADRGVDAGVTLRPHVKTHKMPQLARIQLAAGAEGITVATIGEAEVFADAGFEDIFIAYPLWLDADGAARLRGVAQRARVTFGVDSLESGRRSAQLLDGANVQVLIELDSGQHRSGINPAEAGELAVGLQSVGLDVVGVFTFPGHSYGPEARADAAAAERNALALAATMMRERGVEPLVRSGGSSPSMAYVGKAGTDVSPTDMRPGAYVFNDAQQWELGVCTAADIALTAHARVVSHAGGRLILDAGSKTIAPDKAAWATGHGRLLDFEDARIVQLSEHHAVVDMAGQSLPRLGSVVRVVPNHCCNAINFADAVLVHRGGQRVGEWRVAARGLNS